MRLAAFSFLEEQVAIHGEVLPWGILLAGFTHDRQRVPLLGPQGIFKPAVLSDMPLSITTAPPKADKPAPYDDEFTAEGLLQYRYRGTDPQHPDNVGLRKAMQTQTPVIYFHGIVTGQYLASWPVFVVGDDPAQLTFTVAVDERNRITPPPSEEVETNYRRSYLTRQVRQRMHQADFRVRVIAAYREMCAVCRLRHKELLDAAHILPDTHELGEPLVTNGMALCKLHHAAFDQNIIGVRPDLIVEVNQKVLAEIDGPMLLHGLQGFHGATITVPRKTSLRPDPEVLSERYELFRTAG